MALTEHAIDGTLTECSMGRTSLTDAEHQLMQSMLSDIVGFKRSTRRMRRRRRGTYTFVINYEDGCDVLDIQHFFKKYRTSNLVLNREDGAERFEELKASLEHVLTLIGSRFRLGVTPVTEGKNYGGAPYLIYKVTY